MFSINEFEKWFWKKWFCNMNLKYQSLFLYDFVKRFMIMINKTIPETTAIHRSQKLIVLQCILWIVPRIIPGMIGAVATKSTFRGVVNSLNYSSFIFFVFADLTRVGIMYLFIYLLMPEKLVKAFLNKYGHEHGLVQTNSWNLENFHEL